MHAAVGARLQEQAPRSGDGDEHADAQLARRRRAARDARAAERARAAARAGRADVRVEVVERPCLKKIACASAPYHGVKRAGFPSGR